MPLTIAESNGAKMKRSYSARDIATMRYVIASSTPMTGASHQERIAEIEEKIRTYVAAGIDPSDLADHVNETYFGAVENRSRHSETNLCRLAAL